MTILFNQRTPEFNDDPALDAPDRAQPLAVDPSDHFVVLTQQDGAGDRLHCVLIERRDVRTLIEALLRS